MDFTELSKIAEKLAYPRALSESAEAGSVAAAGESRIVKLVAWKEGEGPVPPCGRCRELIYQLNHENLACEVLLPGGVKTLAQLLPDRWN